MALDVQQRQLMFERFEQALGREVATLLMEQITATDASTLATKGDLRDVRHELDSAIDGVRHEIDGVRKEMQALRHELLSTFHKEMAAQTKSLIFGLAASLAAVAGIAFGLG